MRFFSKKKDLNIHIYVGRFSAKNTLRQIRLAINFLADFQCTKISQLIWTSNSAWGSSSQRRPIHRLRSARWQLITFI